MSGLWARQMSDATQARLGDFGGSADRAGEPELWETFTVLTTEPNDLLADYNDLILVLLDPADARTSLESPNPNLLKSHVGG